MAKVLYSGGGDWMIGPYAYVSYGFAEEAWFVNKPENWPDRLLDTTWPLATEQQIHALIKSIWFARVIEVK